MADAGLQVWGDHGFLQIDQNFRNMALIKSGKINGSTLVESGAGATAPIVVFRAVYPNVAWFTYAVANGSNRQWFCDGVGEYYVFDVPPPQPVNGVGLQVFDPSGNVVFDSRYRYMRPIQMVTITEAAGSNGMAIPGVSIPAGKQYGWAVSSPGYWKQNNFPSSNVRSNGTWAVGQNSGGTGFIQQKKTIQTFSGNVTPDSFSQFQLTICDLTGFPTPP